MQLELYNLSLDAKRTVYPPMNGASFTIPSISPSLPVFLHFYSKPKRPLTGGIDNKTASPRLCG